MAFKKPYKKNSDKNVRVKNSYYSFSKEYPGGVIGDTGRKNRKKTRSRSVWTAVGVLGCFLVVFALSYFMSELALRFSYKQPSETGISENITGTEETDTAQSGFDTPIRALYMPAGKLSDTGYIKGLIRELKRKDFDSVVIDFKTENGDLSFFSNSETALLAKCSAFDNETTEKAIELFEKSGVRIIARLFCFQDALASSSCPELAVKYLNSDVAWLDKPEAEGGKTRLNPYSKDARSYLTDIMGEISSFGISCFLLEEVDFPDSDAADTAGFPGETSKSARGKTLVRFLDEVRAAVPTGATLILSLTADDLMTDGSYSAQLTAGDIDAVCVNSAVRPDTYVIDRKTDYSSILSLFSVLSSKAGQKNRFMIRIDSAEYSWQYVKALKKSGYENVLVFDENGQY